jgi:hypothetical protein
MEGAREQRGGAVGRAGLDLDDDDHCHLAHWMAGPEISRGFWLDFSSSECGSVLRGTATVEHRRSQLGRALSACGLTPRGANVLAQPNPKHTQLKQI